VRRLVSSDLTAVENSTTNISEVKAVNKAETSLDLSMAGGVQVEEPRFWPGVSGCCSLRHGVLVSTSLSWTIWFLITCVFWPGIVHTSSETGRFNRSSIVTVGTHGADQIPLDPEEDLGSDCGSSVSQETLTTWTLVVPPFVSMPGLIVDTIALFRLGACAKRTCPTGLAGCVNGPLARGPLLLPKLIFHGCLLTFLAVVLVLTNVYFCQEVAVLINVVLPFVILFYIVHSVNVYRLRKFKIDFMKGMDTVDYPQDPSVIKLMRMTRRGVLTREEPKPQTSI